MRGVVLSIALVCGLAGGAVAQGNGGNALFAQGRFAEAAGAYKAVPPGGPEFQTSLRRLGAIALYENRFDEAQRDLLDALGRDASDMKTESLLAELASRQGKFAQAAAWLTRAGKPDRAAAFAAFGNVVPYRIVSPAKGAEIPFVQTDPLPVVRARVNGRDGLFIIDTGGAEIVLDPTFAAKAGVKSVGGSTGTFAGGKTAAISYGRVTRLSLGALQIADVPAALVSTAGFSGVTGGKPVAGVIGTSLLMRFLSTVDCIHGKLVFAPRDVAPPKGDVVATIPFWLIGDHFILARGRLDGGAEQMMLIDTGLSGFAFTAPESTLRDAGLPVPTPARTGADAVGNSAIAPFDIASLTLGDLSAKNLQGLYGPFPPSLENALGVHIGGLVSHGFFRPYAITFDFTRMTIVVRK